MTSVFLQILERKATHQTPLAAWQISFPRTPCAASIHAPILWMKPNPHQVKGKLKVKCRGFLLIFRKSVKENDGYFGHCEFQTARKNNVLSIRSLWMQALAWQTETIWFNSRLSVKHHNFWIKFHGWTHKRHNTWNPVAGAAGQIMFHVNVKLGCLG